MGKSVKEGIMPKEFIENRYFGQYATDHSQCAHPPLDPDGDCAGKQVPLDGSVIKVGWSKEAGHVEIAVLPTYEHEHDGVTWYTQFDRRGINRLIRVLRTARDDAYGKDE